jgi:DnaJ like chaperone protein
MEQAARLSEFEVLLTRSSNPLGTSVLLVLAWIAASDGEVDAAERQQLEQIAQASEHGPEIEALLRCSQRRDIGALQLACEIVRDHFPGDKATLFIEMAIGMAIADAVLRPTENFILRFIADLMGIDRGRLNTIFLETTGRAIPEPSDPSSASYWQSQERARQQQRDAGGSGSSRQQSRESSRDQKAVQSYAVLGLDYGASIDEVKRAYRRLAQVHHPDKFSALGKEAVAAATATFQRIQDAYQHLVNHA